MLAGRLPLPGPGARHPYVTMREQNDQLLQAVGRIESQPLAQIVRHGIGSVRPGCGRAAAPALRGNGAHRSSPRTPRARG